MTTTGRRLTAFLSLLGLTAGSAGLAARDQRYPAALIRSMLDTAVAAAGPWVRSRDAKSGDTARKGLDDVIKAARVGARRDPACEPCVEHLVVAEFYNAALGFEKNFGACLDDAGPAMARFPANGRIALFGGAAFYRKGDFATAGRALKHYMASSARNQENDAFAAPMIADSQSKFIDAWYNQANYYQTDESRILQMNSKTFKNDVVFQFTPDYELQIGRQGVTALTANTKTANDPEAVAFLQQLVTRLTSKTPGPGFSYAVTLLDSPQVNAVTPPGFILVNTGLLRFVDTEAQLAGVLSHELAHNYAHHSARRLIKSYHVQQVGAAVVKAINPSSAAAQAITNLSVSMGAGLFLNAYSRFEEKEADLYGSHVMFNAGYHPTALSGFFLKMDRANPKQPPKLLSTHPPLPDRTDYLTDYIEGFPLDRELVVDSSEAFKQIKARYPSLPPAAASSRQ